MRVFLDKAIVLVYLVCCRWSLACTNFNNVEEALISTYTDLADAIDCCVTNLGVLADITVGSELYITECSMSIYGVGNVSLSADTSRIFQVVNSTLQISDITLNGGSIGDANGGGMLISHSAVTLDGVNLVRGMANSGGAIQVDSSTVVMRSCSIANNTAASSGGAIHCKSNGEVSMSNVLLTENKAPNGGGLSGEGCLMTLSDSSLINNHAMKYGGCIYASQSTIILSNTTLHHCNVELSATGLGDDSQGGGIYAVLQSTVNITLSLFSNCSASTAALLKLSASEGNIHSSVFQDNWASNHNMEIVGRMTHCRIQSSVFQRNRCVRHDMNILTYAGSAMSIYCIR